MVGEMKAAFSDVFMPYIKAIKGWLKRSGRTTEAETISVEDLHQKLTACLNTVKLGVAGRFIYFEDNTFILAMHSTSPEKTHEATEMPKYPSSLDQLWLSFVQHELHNKTWTGTEWKGDSDGKGKENQEAEGEEATDTAGATV